MICQELESFVNQLCCFLHQDWDYTCEVADWPDGSVTLRGVHEDHDDDEMTIEIGIEWLGQQTVAGVDLDFVLIKCKGGDTIFPDYPHAVAAWLCN